MVINQYLREELQERRIYFCSWSQMAQSMVVSPHTCRPNNMERGMFGWVYLLHSKYCIESKNRLGHRNIINCLLLPMETHPIKFPKPSENSITNWRINAVWRISICEVLYSQPIKCCYYFLTIYSFFKINYMFFFIYL